MFVFGAIIGSFVACQYDRIKAGWNARDIAMKPSQCASCHKPIKAWHNIPIISYIRQKGRCTYCDAVIPRRLFWIELSIAVLFVILYIVIL